MSIFSLLAYDPLVTDIGETTFVFDHGVIHVDMLDNGRAQLTMRVLEHGTLVVKSRALLHSKGFLKTELKKDQRQDWVDFFGQSFNDLDKALNASNVAEQLNAWSQTIPAYQTWLQTHPFKSVTAVAVDTRKHLWKVYQNFDEHTVVLSILPEEKRCFAHPCDPFWHIISQHLNAVWHDKNILTAEDVFVTIQQYCRQFKEGPVSMVSPNRERQRTAVAA